MEQKDNTIWIGLGIFAAIGLFWYLSRQQKLIQPTQISNSEVWNWTDYKGHARSFSITRDVKAE